MKENLKKRMKSYSFWTALAAAVVILVQSIASIFGAKINEQIISNIVMAICGVLVVFGIVSKPVEEIEVKNDDKEK